MNSEADILGVTKYPFQKECISTIAKPANVFAGIATAATKAAILTGNMSKLIPKLSVGLPQSLSYSYVIWSIDSNKVSDSTGCYFTPNTMTQIDDNSWNQYAGQPGSPGFIFFGPDGGLMVYNSQKGNHYYNVTFSTDDNKGPVLVYMVVGNLVDTNNDLYNYTIYTNEKTTLPVNDCKVVDVDQPITWYDIEADPGTVFYFYIADAKGNSNTIPMYSGKVSFQLLY